jgi:hypothetical protein
VWVRNYEKKFLENKSNANAWTWSGPCNFWLSIPFLRYSINQKSQGEISLEHGGWGNRVAWTSLSLFVVLTENVNCTIVHTDHRFFDFTLLGNEYHRPSDFFKKRRNYLVLAYRVGEIIKGLVIHPEALWHIVRANQP